MNPQVNAFFVGRALAQALLEQGQKAFTDLLSEMGKFDAEQRANLRQFTGEVMERAAEVEAASISKSPLTSTSESAAYPLAPEEKTSAASSVTPPNR